MWGGSWVWVGRGMLATDTWSVVFLFSSLQRKTVSGLVDSWLSLLLVLGHKLPTDLVGGRRCFIPTQVFGGVLLRSPLSILSQDNQGCLNYGGLLAGFLWTIQHNIGMAMKCSDNSLFCTYWPFSKSSQHPSGRTRKRGHIVSISARDLPWDRFSLWLSCSYNTKCQEQSWISLIAMDLMGPAALSRLVSLSHTVSVI